MAADRHRPVHLESVLDAWQYLGPRERRALAIIAERLLSGQTMYGQLYRGKKDWKREGFEECCDLAVYMAAGLLDEEDRKA